MQITGKIIAALPAKSGTSAKGEWMYQTYVLETQAQYQKKLAFDVFGAERIKQFRLQVGDVATVHFDVDAHEYNGRWYNSVRAYNVEKSGLQTQIVDVVMPQGATQAPQQQNSSAPQQQNMFNAGVQNAAPYQPTQQPQAADPNDLPF